VHDIVWFETNGLPGVFFASTAFVDTAELQSASLGLPDVRRVFVEHPFSFGTDDEIRAKADRALPAVIAALTENR
jgi:hypothetical protein